MPPCPPDATLPLCIFGCPEPRDVVLQGYESGGMAASVAGAVGVVALAAARDPRWRAGTALVASGAVFALGLAHPGTFVVFGYNGPAAWGAWATAALGLGAGILVFAGSPWRPGPARA